MDIKIGISIFINKAPPQKLVLAPGAIIRGNTVCGFICAKFKLLIGTSPSTNPTTTDIMPRVKLFCIEVFGFFLDLQSYIGFKRGFFLELVIHRVKRGRFLALM